MAKPKLEREIFEDGDEVEITNIEPLPGNTVAPPLEIGEKKKVKNITLDSGGNQHLDLGIRSVYSFIKSYETEENLVAGNVVHWVHPSRCKKIVQ